MNFERSRGLYERARRHLAGGVSTIMRADAKPLPLYFERGFGSRLVDVDGNEFIDYTLAFGPTILGHSHARILEAVTRQLERGQAYGAQHELEPQVAERIHELVACADLIVFSTTGTEAVQIALRLARAATGRRRFIKFEGHYHGWLDNVLVSYRGAEDQLGPRDQPTPVPMGRGQLDSAVQEAIILPWNDIELVEQVLRARSGEIAAILTEPVMCNSGGITPLPGYLEGLRSLCDRYGVALIFDEVITGFRVALGGAQERFGVVPDLAIFGKALGGGFPISAVAGKRSIMELVATREVIHAGTFNGSPIALAAANATLAELSADGGAIYQQLSQLGDRLRHGILDAAGSAGIEATADGIGPAFTVSFGSRRPLRDYRDFIKVDGAAYGRFAEAVLYDGIFCLQRGMWYVSTAHTDADIETTIDRVAAVLRRTATSVPG